MPTVSRLATSPVTTRIKARPMLPPLCGRKAATSAAQEKPRPASLPALAASPTLLAVALGVGTGTQLNGGGVTFGFSEGSG